MEVFWTKFALDSLNKIFKYYKINAGSIIANKLKFEIIDVSLQLCEHPYSGSEEEYLIELNQNHRYIVRGKFKIIYKISKDKIYITDVFDVRQNPKKLNTRNK